MANQNQVNINLSFTADTSQAERQLESLKTALLNATQSASRSSSLGITEEISGAITQANKLQVALSNATMDTGKLDLTKFKQELKSAGLDAKNIRESLFSLGPAGEAAFAQLTRAITTAEIPLKRTSTLLKKFAETLTNTAKWQIASTAIHKFSGAISGAVGYMKDLNESLNKIRIVTGQSTDEMAKFAKEANAAAKALSVSTTAYTDASLIFYQQGLTGDAVKERTDTVIKLSNVTGDSVQDVASYMTAIWNNFDNGSESLEHYADVITALGASTASSSAEIAAGLEKFAAIGETVGLSYDYATSALAAVVANTRQSAETVGNAFKTIFARMESLKLGETLEDNVDLTKYTAAIEAVGVQVLDTNGELRDLDNILEDLAVKWEVMNSAQKSALAQTVAGTRQYNQFVALLENWDDVQTNLITAKNSEGSLQKQSDIYAEGWEGASKRVRATLQSIYQDLLDDKGFVSIINGFEGFLNIVKNVIDALGGMKGLLSGLGVLVFKIFGEGMAKSLDNFANNLKIKLGVEGEEILKMREAFSEQLKTGFGDTGESRERQQIVDSYRQQSSLQDAIIDKTRELNREGKTLTENEQKRLNLALDLQEVLANEARETARRQDEMMASSTGSRLDANFLVSSTFSTENIAEQVAGINQQIKEGTEDLERYKSAAEGALNLFQASGAAEDEQAWQNATQAIRDQEAAIQSLVDTRQRTEEQSTNLQQQINEIQKLSEAYGIARELLVNFQTSAEGAGEAIAQINLKDIIQALDDLGITIEDKDLDDIEQLKNALNELAEGSTTTANVEQKLANTLATLQTKVTSVNRAFQGTANADRMNRALETMRNNSAAAGQAHVQHAMSVKNLGNAFKDAKNAIDSAQGSTLSFSQQIVMIGSSLASFGMLVNTLKGSIEKLFDPDVSGFDKIIPLLTSVGMSIGMLVGLIDKMNKVVKANVAIKNAHIAALTAEAEAEEVKLALTTTGIGTINAETAAKLNEVLASEAVVSATAAEAMAEEICTAAKAKGITISEAQALVLAKSIIAKKADALAATGDAAAHGLLATAALKAAAAVKAATVAIMSNPIVLIIAGIAAGVAALVSGIVSAAEEADRASIESNKKIIEEEQKKQEQIDSNVQLAESYNQLYIQYNHNIDVMDDLAKTSEELAKVLEQEGYQVNLLADGYGKLSEKAKEYQKQKLDEAIKSAENTANKAKANVILSATSGGTGNGYMSGDNYKVGFSQGWWDGLFNNDSEYAVMNTLKKVNGLRYYNTDDFTEFNDFEIKNVTADKLVDFYDKLVEGRDLINREVSEADINSSDVYTGLNEWIDRMTPEIETYREALETIKDYKAQLATVDKDFSNIDFTKDFSDNASEFRKEREEFFKEVRKQFLESDKSDEEVWKIVDAQITAKNSKLSDLTSYIKKIEGLIEGAFNDATFEQVNEWYSGLSEYQQNLLTKYGLDGVKTFEAANKRIKDLIQKEVQENAEVMYNITSDVISKLQSGDITAENAKYLTEDPGEDADKKTKEQYEAYQMLIGAAQALAEMYPEMTADVEVLNKAWLVGTQEYLESLEKIQQKLHTLDIKQKISEAEKLADELGGLTITADDSDFVKTMDELINKEYEIDVAIHAEAEREFNRLENSMADLEKKAAMINEDYIVAADSLRDLNNTFPGIVENLEIVGDGTVKLNKEIAESAIAGAKAEVAADTEKTIANIQNAATTLRVKQKLYQSMAEDAAQLAQMEVTSDQTAASLKEDIIKKYNEAKSKDNEYATNFELTNDQKLAQSSNENAEAVFKNWRNAYQQSLEANAQYAQQAIKNFQAIADKKLSDVQGSGVVNVNYQGSNGSTISSQVPEELEKVLNGEEVSSQEYQKLTELFTEMATNAGAKANDLEGMIPALTAQLYKTFDKGGKGKSNKQETKDLKDFNDEFDRFYPYVKKIEDLADALNDLDKAKEHLFGGKLVAALKQENAMLDQQTKNYKALLKEKQKYQKELRKGYKDDYGKHQYGLEDYGMQFDSATGNITNWAQVTSEQNKKMNDAIIAYNKSAQSEADKALLEAAEKNYEHFKDLISKYQQGLKDIEEEQNALDDIIYKQITNNLQQFDIELEVQLDFEEAQRKVNEFLKKIKTDFKQVFKENADWLNVFDTAIDNAKSFTNTLNADKTALAEIEKILANDTYEYGTEGAMFVDRTEAIKKYQELAEQIMSDGESLYDLAEKTWDDYLSAIDEVLDQWDVLLDGFDLVSDKLDHSRKILELLYGGDDTRTGRANLDSYYESQLNVSLGKQKALGAEIEALEKQLVQARADNNSEDVKKYTDAINDATDKLYTEMENYLETAQSRFKNSIKTIIDTADTALSGDKGLGLGKLSERWDDALAAAEGYYDEVEKVYQLDSLQNKWEKLISSSKNLKNQQYLTSLMDAQLKKLKEKTELSEYDIGLAEKELAIIQAEMALEDARENKNSMKLVRNEQGNWTYQYVADQAEEEKKQQEMIDALYDKYEYVKNANREATEDLLKLQQEAQERISAIADEMASADETRRAELQEELDYLYEYYYGESGLIVKKSREASDIKTDLDKAGMETLWGLYTTDQTNYETMIDNEKKLIDDLNSHGLQSFRDLVNQVSLGDDSLYKQMYEQCNKVIGDTQSEWEASAGAVVRTWGDDSNPQSVKAVMLKVLTDIKGAVTTYDSEVKTAESVNKEQWEKIKGYIHDTDEEVKGLTSDIDTLVGKTNDLETYRKKVEEVNNEWDKVSKTFDGLLKKLGDYLTELGKIPTNKTTTITTKYETIGSGKDTTKTNPKPTSDGTPSTVTGGGGGGEKPKDKTFYHYMRDQGDTGGYYFESKTDAEKYKGLTGNTSAIIDTTSSSGLKASGKSSLTYITSGGSPSYNPSDGWYYKDQYLQTTSLDTGGYTGTWGPDGRVAMLHEKELVLNKEDTSNLLSAVGAIREITGLGDSIVSSIASGISGMVARMLGIKPELGDVNQSTINQGGNTFNIHAEFPNANSVAEIEQAILNLPNLANQYLSTNLL